MTTVRDVARVLEAWAPAGTAQSYDNTGLQVGDPSAPVERALIALDLTAEVIDEAEREGATLVVTHHPLLFRPLKRLTPEGGPAALAYRLARAGIALYTAHTNLDAARGGVSFALARQLGLEGVRFLDPLAGSLYKLATFVPPAHLEVVRTALADAGAGQIGDYEACAFVHPGTGHFRPGPGAAPFTQTPEGVLERADEVRIEVEVARWALGRVLEALRAAHPYEEPAYDVYPVEQASTRFGMGAVGTLAEPETLERFLARAAERLPAEALRFVGDPGQRVQTVAVCGGAGRDLIPSARRAGADLYLTADLTYHTFFDVLGPDGAPQMALVDAGHYETERITEELLAEHLRAQLPGIAWQRTALRTSPVQTFTR